MGLGLDCRPPPPQSPCPVHVGIVVAERFAHYDHEPLQKYQDSFDKIERAKNQIKWIVNKGDLLPSDGGLTTRLKLVRKMTQTGSQAGTIRIVTSTYDGPHKPPSHFVQPVDGEGEFSILWPELLLTMLSKTNRAATCTASHPVVSLDYNLRDMEAVDPRTYGSVMGLQRGAQYHRAVMEVELNITAAGGTASQ